MARAYSIYVTDTPEASEFIGDTPKTITHKRKTYKVQHVVLSWDIWGSNVKIFYPIRLPGEPLMYIHHQLSYRDLTTTQRKKFFPRSIFLKTWKRMDYAKMLKEGLVQA